MKYRFFKTAELIIILFISFCVLLIPRILKAEDSIKIYYHSPAQVELISPHGSRVFIDIIHPILLSNPQTKNDILLTTHGHGDHYNAYFASTFPGRQLCVRTGKIKLKDVMIQGIASKHNENDEFMAAGGTNYIFIIDMGGLRIAHFGDIGQNALTPEQLTTLGKVDIAITQLSNAYSEMNAANRKGFRIMDQVNPRLIIPTHVNAHCAGVAGGKWKAYHSRKEFLTISVKDLSDKTSIIFMDKNVDLWDFPESNL